MSDHVDKLRARAFVLRGVTRHLLSLVDVELRFNSGEAGVLGGVHIGFAIGGGR